MLIIQWITIKLHNCFLILTLIYSKSIFWLHRIDDISIWYYNYFLLLILLLCNINAIASFQIDSKIILASVIYVIYNLIDVFTNMVLVIQIARIYLLYVLLHLW